MVLYLGNGIVISCLVSGLTHSGYTAKTNVQNNHSPSRDVASLLSFFDAVEISHVEHFCDLGYIKFVYNIKVIQGKIVQICAVHVK